jgi:HAD domain in Swiss Army Knife RNA repair proteins
MLIFLDIDGVMVSAKSWKSPELLNDGFPAFSLKAVRVLQNLISEDTTVMLTTSHKSRFTIEEWKAIFQKRGLQVSILKSLSDNINCLSRKDEVLNWFNLNNVSEDFIIIDDDKSLNGLPSFLKDRLILTSSLIGLTESHLDEIKSVLSQKPQIA